MSSFFNFKIPCAFFILLIVVSRYLKPSTFCLLFSSLLLLSYCFDCIHLHINFCQLLVRYDKIVLKILLSDNLYPISANIYGIIWFTFYTYFYFKLFLLLIISFNYISVDYTLILSLLLFHPQIFSHFFLSNAFPRSMKQACIYFFMLPDSLFSFL